jgi:hypothetical protein
MTAKTARKQNPLARVTAALGLSLALLGAGAVGYDLLAREASQARAFVADGQRALSRDDRPGAVLSFEQARWLAPRADFVRSAIAAAGVKDVEPPLPRALRYVTAREWSAIATVFGWTSAFGIILVVVQWQRRRALRAALAAGCASVIGMAGVVESNASSPAVVTSVDAHLLVAPYASAAAEGALPAGTMVLVGPRHETFVHVSDGEGQTGWLPHASVKCIAGSEG